MSDRRSLFSLFGIIGIVLIAQIGHDTWISLLEYRRNAILEGEVWRALSGHLMHLGWTHTLLNLLGLVLISRIFRPVWPGFSLLWAVLALSILSSIFLLLSAPQLLYYVGLSGVLHGLMAQALIRDDSFPRGLRVLVLLGLIAKVIWEQSGFYDGAAMAGLINGPVAVQAHLAGLVAGFCWTASQVFFTSLRE